MDREFQKTYVSKVKTELIHTYCFFCLLSVIVKQVDLNAETVGKSKAEEKVLYSRIVPAKKKKLAELSKTEHSTRL